MTKENKSTIKLILYYMSITAKLEPRIYLSFLITTISTSAFSIALVYLPKIVIDGIVSDWNREVFITTVLKWGIIIILLRLLSELSLRQFEKDRLMVNQKINSHMSNKVLALKYQLLEDPEVLDLKNRASYPINNLLLLQLLEQSKNTFIHGLQLIGLSAILYSFSPWILLFLIIMCLVGGYFLEKSSKIQEQFIKDIMPINRRYNYYLNALVDEEFQKEFRLYSLDNVVKDKLQVLMDVTLDRIHEVHADTRNVQIKNFLIISVSRFVIYSYAGLKAMALWGKQISLGNFAVVITASEQFTKSVSEIITSVIDIMRTIRFFQPLAEFEELEVYSDSGNTTAANPIVCLEFKNVTFRYPKTDKIILDNISFKLHKGETLALVGRNNAGKSTIVKLIARLFEPNSGEILWNGINIKELNLESYLKELAYVFQDFQLFPLQIWENISCHTSKDNSIPVEIQTKVEDTINRVGFSASVNKLPNGIRTRLNKFLYEDAADFSGGEKQKIAIARAIFKDASFAILDEPTAALDPLAESEIYGNFSELVKGKTALFISHRMSASRFCDRILVLDNGKIIGNGHHEELVKHNELYRRLYEAQAQYYV
ncbi:MAG: ABC transporter ATP-binding protein [Tissierellia bacterium]|nr:ABC transporter ATP-binding protein [Tissierellia bacterium]